ncbi:MAG TPA: DUF2057 domain-containing protein [Psychromonas hadalis]|nr:DUF2057 domain-containing protein [Psychromonas hadalis]
MKYITALAFLLFTSFTTASTLSVPNEFEFLAVNGVEVENALFSKTDEVDLPPGDQRIAIRYKTTVRHDIGDGATRLESLAMIISLQVEENKKYRVSAAVSLSSLKKATAYANHPTITITDTSGKSADFSVHLPSVEDYGLIGNAIHKEDKITATIAQQGTLKVSKTTTNKSTTTEMLHHWWDQADKKTQQEFIEFAKKNAKK